MSVWTNKFQEVCQQLNTTMAPARINFQNGDPLLHKSAFTGDLDKVRTLLRDSEHCRLINVRNRLGCTPIRLAATAGHANCVLSLIQCRADVNLADVKAQTPLFVAVKNRHINCVLPLLAAGANPDGDPMSLCTPLYVAAMDGFLEGVQALIQYGADLNLAQRTMDSFTSTPLYIALAYHRLQCFRSLLIAGADPNSPLYRHNSLYHAAVKHFSDQIYVQLLYDFGADIYTRDNGRLVTELEHDNECRRYLRDVIDKTRSLKSTCRIFIRHQLGSRRLDRLDQLPLPNKLITYLSHQCDA